MKIFLTGQKQIGKSTCIQECIRECHKSVCGFVTLPFYEGTRRSGFYLHALHAMEKHYLKILLEVIDKFPNILGVLKKYDIQYIHEIAAREDVTVLDLDKESYEDVKHYILTAMEAEK